MDIQLNKNKRFHIVKRHMESSPQKTRRRKKPRVSKKNMAHAVCKPECDKMRAVFCRPESADRRGTEQERKRRRRVMHLALSDVSVGQCNVADVAVDGGAVRLIELLFNEQRLVMPI